MMPAIRADLLQRYRFDVEDLRQMVQARIIDEDARVELIDGELVELPMTGGPHKATVARLDRCFHRACGDRVIVWVQNDLELDQRTLVVPDLMLLKPRAHEYRGRDPRPKEVLLLVEVADTSVNRDLEVKVPLYAYFGVPLVWVVDLPDKIVHSFRDPFRGRYRDARQHRGTDLLPVPPQYSGTLSAANVVV